MKGTYQMKRMVDEEHFDVKIPEFMLIAPFKLN
jgi:ApaG protein